MDPCNVTTREHFRKYFFKGFNQKCRTHATMLQNTFVEHFSICLNVFFRTHLRLIYLMMYQTLLCNLSYSMSQVVCTLLKNELVHRYFHSILASFYTYFSRNASSWLLLTSTTFQRKFLLYCTVCFEQT